MIYNASLTPRSGKPIDKIRSQTLQPPLLSIRICPRKSFSESQEVQIENSLYHIHSSPESIESFNPSPSNLRVSFIILTAILSTNMVHLEICTTSNTYAVQ